MYSAFLISKKGNFVLKSSVGACLVPTWNCQPPSPPPPAPSQYSLTYAAPISSRDGATIIPKRQPPKAQIYRWVQYRTLNGNVLFNETLNTFYLRLYGVGFKQSRLYTNCFSWPTLINSCCCYCCCNFCCRIYSFCYSPDHQFSKSKKRRTKFLELNGNKHNFWSIGKSE